MGARTLVVTGSGGAGTSTVALATAHQLRDGAARVGLVSAAPVPPAALTAGLELVPVAPQQAFEALWSRHAGTLAGLVPTLTLPPGSSVVAPPGAAELAMLSAVASAGARCDVVVVDAGALPQAMTLLTLPGALRWWLGQLAPTRVRMLGAVRTAAVRAGAVRRGPVDDLLAALPAVESLLGALPLDDPARTTVHVVLRPEPAAAGALRSLLTELAVVGQQLTSVTVNRLLPAGPGDWSARRTAQQDALLAAVRACGVPLQTVAEAAEAPADLPALLALGAAVAPGSPAPADPPPGAVRVADGWQLRLALPYAPHGQVELTRWEDDLVVTAGARRRSFPLDSLLRRCVVAGGRLDSPGTPAAALEVLFRPDADLWPAGLLESEGTPA